MSTIEGIMKHSVYSFMITFHFCLPNCILDYDPTVKEPKPVGQREWTPTNDNRGPHTYIGYKANVGGGGRAGRIDFKLKIINIEI